MAQLVYRRFMFGMDCLPDPVKRSNERLNKQIYQYMWGEQEFTVSGALKPLCQTNRLHEIAVPVLLLCGRNDEATPKSVAKFHARIPEAQMRGFEESTHLPHWTERERYMAVVEEFLATAEL